MPAMTSEKELEQLYWEAEERAHTGRLKRLREMNSVEDPEPAWISALAREYYEEARLCWVYGAFVATIMMSQLALEELLRSHYRSARGVGGRLDSGKEVDRSGFKDLTEQAKKDGIITLEEFIGFKKLREDFRNPYVHSKDFTAQNDFEQPNFLKQGIKITAPELGIGDVQDEAGEAIALLVTTFREISRKLFPLV